MVELEDGTYSINDLFTMHELLDLKEELSRPPPKQERLL